MCKVLGLRFFDYKVMIYFFIFFGLGPELETNQAFPTTHTPSSILFGPKRQRMDEGWVKMEV
jgi:hypothetical protein